MITLPFKSFVDTFVFDSDLYIKKGSVIRFPEEERRNFVNLSNPGKNPEMIPPFKLTVLNFIPSEKLIWNSSNILLYKVNQFKDVSIIKSIKNDSFLPIHMPGFYGEIIVKDQQVLETKVVFIKV